jgi:hypothetical protein
LFGYETWSVTLREEYRLKVFENRVLGRIFEPMREKVTRGWRKLRIEELLHQGDGAREDEMDGTCSMRGRA